MAVAGAWAAVALAGPTDRTLGPFDAQLSLSPAWRGESVLALPPLGDVQFRTHRAPVLLEVRLRAVRPEAVSELAAQQQDLERVGAELREELRHSLLLLVLRDGVLAVTGAAGAVLLVLRAPRRAAVAAGGALVVLVATSGATAATFDESALQEPEFTGALTYAPALVGDVRDVLARLDDYSRQLGRLVTNVAGLYDAASTLPTYQASAGTVRLLHVSDLHLSPSAYPLMREVVAQFEVDVVLDTGDVADHGTSVENAYVAGIATLGVPYVYVRGNHDSVATQDAVRRQPGTHVLDDGLPVTVAGLTFLGEGDPRFTPDKRTRDDSLPREELERVGERLLALAQAQTEIPDVVAVHDPVSAGPLLGEVPLVLAGHTHERQVEVRGSTRLMVQGSTGGAGLRALEGEEPTPVTMTVLYLDRATGTLQAYDEITLGGLGLSDARIRRQVVRAGEPAEAAPGAVPSATAVQPGKTTVR